MKTTLSPLLLEHYYYVDLIECFISSRMTQRTHSNRDLPSTNTRAFSEHEHPKLNELSMVFVHCWIRKKKGMMQSFYDRAIIVAS